MQSEANRSKMIFMQRRDIREYFLPPDEKYYQHASKELDMYGLGKTFQYILASVEAEPRFNRREEYRLQRIISKAMGIRSTHYLNVSEIQKQIPRYEEKDRDKILNNKGKRRKSVYNSSFVYCFQGIFVHKCMGKMLKKQTRER